MRLVFLGSGAFGVPTLRTLFDRHEVAMVVTQPDRPAGRGGKLKPTPIADLAESAQTVVIKPERINRPEIIEQVRAVDAEAWVVIAYGQKLGTALLDGIFAINLHASLLPRWRGAAPIHHAVIAGDGETGNSVITLAEEMDAGDVLATTRRPIEQTQTTGELHDLLSEDGPTAVLDVLEAHRTGRVQRTVQDPAQVTLAPKLSRQDAAIDFARRGEECRSHINGLSPWPGCTVELGGAPVKLLRAGPAAGNGAPGELLDAARGIVACGDGAVQLLTIQPAGRTPMPYTEFARGRSLESGAPVTPITPR